MQIRTVSLSSNKIFIFEDDDPGPVSPAEIILVTYPATAETTSMIYERQSFTHKSRGF